MPKRIEIAPLEQILVCDGAMGTMIHSKGVPLGQSFDEINLSQPEVVAGIHRAYVEAGARIIETNTFGANRLKMDVHGLGHRVRDMNIAGARIARECAAGDTLVAGSVGPTGKLMQPFGPLDFDTVLEVYAEQLESLIEGSVDLVIIETMQDLREAKAALLAAKTFSDMPTIVQVSFAQEGRSMMGTPPDVAAAVLSACGASLVGANCGTGPQDMLSAIEAMSTATSTGLSAQPNAGLPKFYDGRLMYISTPAYLADFAVQFVECGAVVVGGCCGTTPDHVKAVTAAVDGMKPVSRKRDGVTRVASRTNLAEIGGERILVMASALLSSGATSAHSSEQALQSVQSEVERQWRQGAAVVALDCDSLSAAAPRLVELAQTSSQAALCLVGSDLSQLEFGLRSVEGRCLLMASTPSDDAADLMTLAHRYGAAVLLAAQTSDSHDTEARIAAVSRMLDQAERVGLHRADIVVHAGELFNEDGEMSRHTVDTLRAVKSQLQMNTAAGFSRAGANAPSDLSQGLRKLGLDLLIADPGRIDMSVVGASRNR